MPLKITQPPSDVLYTSLEGIEIALRQFAVRVVRKQRRFMPHKGAERWIGPHIRNFVSRKDTFQCLEPVIELGLSLPHKRSQLYVMLPDNRGHKFLEMFIKPASQRIITTQLRKFPIDSPDNLNIIMFDKLQILLLIFLRTNSKILVNLLVQFALLIFLPLIQIEVIFVFVTQ